MLGRLNYAFATETLQEKIWHGLVVHHAQRLLKSNPEHALLITRKGLTGCPCLT